MSEEHTVAIVSFEGAIKREVKRIRERLKPAAELIGNAFQFEIQARGRILDGEVKLEYTIAGLYGENKVEGRDVNSVLEEYLRRSGWNAVNKPLEIAFDKLKEQEIPF